MPPQALNQQPAGMDKTWPTLAKNPRQFAVRPNLSDYAATCRSFSWDAARRMLDGLPGGRGLNIAHEAVDTHSAGELASHVAFRFINRAGHRHDLTFAGLHDATSRFANVLTRLGVHKGDVVVTLAGRIPELYIAALGTLKAGAVYSPFFSAFGPEPIRARMNLSKARVLVTTEALYHRKIAPQRVALLDLAHVLIAGVDAHAPVPPGTLNLQALMAGADPHFIIPPTAPEDPALLHFTSGTTGLPKGAVHVHGAVVAHHVTARYALDLHPDDVFWCTADPGWVTGTSYGIIAPLTNGVTTIVDEADFEADRWYDILADEKVSVWYTAPTAIRMMMKYGSERARRRRYPSLRFLASVGEPLNPEAVMWGVEAFGLPFHDNWWQTETGGIMVANFEATPIKPGSMGLPMPGVEAAIVLRDELGGVRVAAPGEQGELALKPGWPSMFRGYLNDEVRYARCFVNGYYLTGDLARRDEDGYYWFVGRADDVIKSSGHLIGPFEVESALIEHPAVAEAGVIGKPDEMAFEVVKAFVSLKPGFTAGEALRDELMGFARQRLGAVVAPREIVFVDALPRTRSGKILRRLLRARDMGLPEGDTSTLEPPP